MFGRRAGSWVRAGIRLRFAAEEIVGYLNASRRWFLNALWGNITEVWLQGASLLGFRVFGVYRQTPKMDPRDGFIKRGGGVTEKLRFGAAFE